MTGEPAEVRRARTAPASPAPTGATAEPEVVSLSRRASSLVVAIRLGPAAFGLPIEDVREVLRTPPLARVPFPPPAVYGAAAVRGELLPVLDLGLRLRRRPAERPGRLVVVLAPAPTVPVALLVDAVIGLVDPRTASFGPAPAEAEATLPPGWVIGVLIPESGRPVALLDLGRVLDLERPRAAGPTTASSDPVPAHV